MQITRQGRDEPNLAQFPLFVFEGKTTQTSQHVRVFETDVTNPVTGRAIKRRFTMSCKDAGRLPTVRDDLVLTGIISLTDNKYGFDNPQVRFTRPELLRYVGWKPTGQAYKDLDAGINLWANIKLKYDAAWFDPKSGTHINKTFQFFVDVDAEVYDNERIKSYTITWHPSIFNYLRDNFLHKLDLDLYCRLIPVAKRIYRFLTSIRDVDAQVFDLHSFARVHVGIDANAKKHVGEIKRTLNPAIHQLESEGVIVPLDLSERYQKQEVGSWNIRLRLATTREIAAPLPCLGPAPSPADDDPAVDALLAVKISREVAVELAGLRPADYIHQWIAYAVSKDPKSFKRNMQAFLVDALRKGYDLPNDVASKRHREPPTTHLRKADEMEQERSNRVLAHRKSLTPEQLAHIEAIVLDQAGPEKRTNIKGTAAPLRSAMITSLIDDHIRRLLYPE